EFRRVLFRSPAKLRLLEGFRTRDDLGWGHARLALIDFQYHDIDPDRGLHNRLVSKGAMRRLTTDEQIEHAVVTPPESTRAWARGRFIAEIGDRVVAAGWDHVVVTDSRGRTRHVDLTDPFTGHKPYCEAHPDFLTPDGPDFLTADGPAVHCPPHDKETPMAQTKKNSGGADGDHEAHGQ